MCSFLVFRTRSAAQTARSSWLKNRFTDSPVWGSQTAGGELRQALVGVRETTEVKGREAPERCAVKLSRQTLRIPSRHCGRLRQARARGPRTASSREPVHRPNCLVEEKKRPRIVAFTDKLALSSPQHKQKGCANQGESLQVFRNEISRVLKRNTFHDTHFQDEYQTSHCGLLVRHIC